MEWNWNRVKQCKLHKIIYMFFSSTLSSPLLTGIPAETDIPAPVIATTRLLDWKALARRVKWGWALASLKSSKLIVCIQKSVIKEKKGKIRSFL